MRPLSIPVTDNSKELQMKFDTPNFSKPWKISLEDHYQTPDTLESEIGRASCRERVLFEV